MRQSSGVGQIIVYIISLIAISIVISGIVWLLRSLQCSPRVGNRYEGFDEDAEDEQLPETRKKIEKWLISSHNTLSEKLNQILNFLEDTIQTEMDEKEDTTCKIYKELEDTFQKTQIAKQKEKDKTKEKDMSTEDKRQLANERIKKAKEQFETRKKLFVGASQTKIKLYECFQDVDSSEDVSELLENNDVDLQTKNDRLKEILNSYDFQQRSRIAGNLNQTIIFNVSLLEETIKQLRTKKEGFLNFKPFPRKTIKFKRTPYKDMNLPFQVKDLTKIQKNYVNTICDTSGILILMHIEGTLSSIGEFYRLYPSQSDIYEDLNNKKMQLEIEAKKALKKKTNVSKDKEVNTSKKQMNDKADKADKADKKDKAFLGLF